MKAKRSVIIVLVLAVAGVAAGNYIRGEKAKSILCQPEEPLCIFEPKKSTNAINAPCYTVLTAVATDDQGAESTSEPVVVHFVPKPTPTPCEKTCGTTLGRDLSEQMPQQ